MPLTILSDGDMQELLHSLTLDDVLRLQRRLAEALHEYSTGTQETSVGCSANQPPRTHLKSPDGRTTTLFMPARTGRIAGVKVVTLASGAPATGAPPPSPPAASDSGGGEGGGGGGGGSAVALDGSSTSSSSITTLGGSTLASGGGGSSSSPHASSLKLALRSTGSTTGTASSDSWSASDLPGSPGSRSGRSSPAPPPALPPSLPAVAAAAAASAAGTAPRATTPQGSLTLLRATGEPLALIHAAELTAFRTALASTILLRKRARVHSIAVFGAGKQAYWHLRLALQLRGADVHHVRLINRSFAGAAPLLQAVYQDPRWAALRGANAKLSFSLLSAEYGEYARLLKAWVRDADVLFCCTPALRPLFPAAHLTNAEGRRKGRYLAMIGSYTPAMCEVHPDVLRQAVAPDRGNHHHRHPPPGGVVVVDGLDGCLREAGEIIAAALPPDQLVELGEILMVKRQAMREVEMGREGEPGLTRWLQSGNVIYKSVGLGLMDLAVGEELVAIAGEKGIGLVVEDF